MFNCCMQALLETKRYFVRYVSHEIRTPLNIVVTGLKYFKEMITPWYEKKIHQSNKLQAKLGMIYFFILYHLHIEYPSQI